MATLQQTTSTYARVRTLTEQLAAPLSAEDQSIQSMPDVSPTKWHRAHVTWFFETFVLSRFDPRHEPFDAAFREMFNSYYEGVGPQFPRAQRGLISRPGVDEIGAYRTHVDHRIAALLDRPDLDRADAEDLDFLVELGLNHEQQHQELLLMDIKHVLSINPLRPAYRAEAAQPSSPVDSVGWIDIDAGLTEVGMVDCGFSYDNELPRHTAFLYPYRVADRLVTAGEWLAFIDDGGYERHDLWLSDGWHTAQTHGWTSPSYWSLDGDEWSVHTLGGPRPVDPAEPVCHISFYEADAFARWAGRRLPTEFEWEHTVATRASDFVRRFSIDALHPQATTEAGGRHLRQAFGECWQWTASAYLPYPGFQPAEGAVGEYNGKFMSGQMVLRGSSAFTPDGHARTSYRNFFPPDARWMLSGVRLADGGTP